MRPAKEASRLYFGRSCAAGRHSSLGILTSSLGEDRRLDSGPGAASLAEEARIFSPAEEELAEECTGSEGTLGKPREAKLEAAILELAGEICSDKLEAVLGPALVTDTGLGAREFSEEGKLEQLAGCISWQTQIS